MKGINLLLLDVLPRADGLLFCGLTSASLEDLAHQRFTFLRVGDIAPIDKDAKILRGQPCALVLKRLKYGFGVVDEELIVLRVVGLDVH